jgi:tripartite-type tricarboxylate transporter receptor subunit TctC
MAAERLQIAAGISVRHIPFRGAEGLVEVMTGRIDYYFVPLVVALPVVADGKVTALAVSTPERVPLLPSVPTIAEAGYPDAKYLFWGGLSVPAGTPLHIIDKLRRMSVEQFEAFYREDIAETVAEQAPILPSN